MLYAIFSMSNCELSRHKANSLNYKECIKTDQKELFCEYPYLEFRLIQYDRCLENTEVDAGTCFELFQH